MRLKAIADHNRKSRLEDRSDIDLTGSTAAATQVQAVIAANTEQRCLGVSGEPRVNVVLVNLALDRGTP